MAAAIELPFLHPTLLLAVVGTTVVAAFLLPVGRWRLALSALLGGVVGATLVLARVMPLWGGLHLAA
jgi:uncharacterized membrane protein